MGRLAAFGGQDYAGTYPTCNRFCIRDLTLGIGSRADSGCRWGPTLAEWGEWGAEVRGSALRLAPVHSSDVELSDPIWTGTVESGLQMMSAIMLT